MAIDYLRLQGDLNALYADMMPPMAREGDGIYHYLADKVKQYESARRDRLEASEKVVAGSLLTSVSGSALGIGLIAAGTVGGVATVPLGIGVALAVPAVAMARIVIEKAGAWASDNHHERTKSVLWRSADDLRSYWNKQQGGFFSRLYSAVTDRVHGHERRAEKMLDQVDRLRVPAAERSAAVARILRAHATPDFVEYVQRTALNPHNASARLMSRVKNLVDIDVLFAENAHVPARSPFAAMSATAPGMTGTVAAATVSNLVRQATGAPSVALPDTGEASYGWLTAAMDDGDFLKSLGIELGEYNNRTGQYLVKLDATALKAFTEYEEVYPASLSTLPAGTTDPHSHVRSVPFSDMSRETLHAYRLSLQFEASRSESHTPENASALIAALAAANEESQLRVVAARRQMSAVRSEQSASLDL
ncbi:hypothetical protein [Burkholderia vietnamiensis]|uniref:hypothetical protein n=1 Tax=Burkholderia vietnamiensis TaxID=60552 RepID=UPI001CF1A77F|nr:hypothetical protein [Burkholderia vietnamiensis]MCA8197324.1 hypothetical protein [Burkholderia vietnamiensis]